MDRDGYGPRPGQSEVDRLLEDSRTLSPAGIERVAAGWHPGQERAIHTAEQEALRVLERGGRSSAWDDLRNRILGLTERGEPLVSWRVEHGDVGHRAENALLTAALALLAGADLSPDASETLRRPMAGALPWLLPNAVPGPG